MAAPPLRQVQRHTMHRGQELGAGVNYATPLHPQLPYSKSEMSLMFDTAFLCATDDTTTDDDNHHHQHRRRRPTTDDDVQRCPRSHGLREGPRSILGEDGGGRPGCRCRWRMRVSLGGRFCNSKKMMMTTKPTTTTSSAERTDGRKAKSVQDTSLFVTS